ncbi:MAG: PadR family transcriptional regulator [Thermoplasmataceae archaeon]|nr:MAG: Transcriptional regulator PadR family protein [Thermoplasmatales archaeon E-plasma]
MRDRCNCRCGPFSINMIPPGILKPLILKILEQRNMHGYEIMHEISIRTKGLWRPTPGSIYPALSSLVEEGYVQREEQKQGDRQKFVYTLTESGMNAISDLGKFKEEWKSALDSLVNIW